LLTRPTCGCQSRVSDLLMSMDSTNQRQIESATYAVCGHGRTDVWLFEQQLRGAICAVVAATVQTSFRSRVVGPSQVCRPRRRRSYRRPREPTEQRELGVGKVGALPSLPSNSQTWHNRSRRISTNPSCRRGSRAGSLLTRARRRPITTFVVGKAYGNNGLDPARRRTFRYRATMIHRKRTSNFTSVIIRDATIH